MNLVKNVFRILKVFERTKHPKPISYIIKLRSGLEPTSVELHKYRLSYLAATNLGELGKDGQKDESFPDIMAHASKSLSKVSKFSMTVDGDVDPKNPKLLLSMFSIDALKKFLQKKFSILGLCGGLGLIVSASFSEDPNFDPS